MTSREQLLVARPAKRTDNTSENVFDLILLVQGKQETGAGFARRRDCEIDYFMQLIIECQVYRSQR